MSVIAKDTNQLLVGGYQLYKDLDGSGQLNVYEPIRDELTPLIAARTSPDYFGYALVKYYVIARISSWDTSLVGSFEGYPARYKFGQFQWLQGASRCVGQRQYIDAVEWSEDKTRESFIIPYESISSSFPPDTPPVTVTYNRLLALAISNTTGLSSFNGGIYADGFSYDMSISVTADIAILYRAQLSEISLPPGNTIYFINL